jgi:hypothetical protein
LYRNNQEADAEEIGVQAEGVSVGLDPSSHHRRISLSYLILSNDSFRESLSGSVVLPSRLLSPEEKLRSNSFL